MNYFDPLYKQCVPLNLFEDNIEVFLRNVQNRITESHETFFPTLKMKHESIIAIPLSDFANSVKDLHGNPSIKTISIQKNKSALHQLPNADELKTIRIHATGKIFLMAFELVNTKE